MPAKKKKTDMKEKARMLAIFFISQALIVLSLTFIFQRFITEETHESLRSTTNCINFEIDTGNNDPANRQSWYDSQEKCAQKIYDDERISDFATHAMATIGGMSLGLGLALLYFYSWHTSKQS